MKLALSLAATSALLLSSAANAGVGYIKGADIERGELELEYEHTGSFDDKPSKDQKRAHKLEGYYGLTDAWQIGGGVKYTRSRSDNTDLESVFFEGIYQFIESEEYGFDMAILGEYVHTVEDDSADKLEAKLLYENEWGGHFETKANFIVEQQVGPDSNTSPELAHKIGTVYELDEHFKPGLEWQADYGHVNRFDSAHYVGPVAYGELYELPNHGGEIEYELGYLFGVNDKATDGVLRFLVEYEMEF